MEQIKNISLKLAEAEHRASINAEAAGKVFYLEEAKKEQTDKIEALTRDNAVKDETLKEVKKTAQELSDELTAIKNKWWYKLFGGKK